MLSLKTTTLIFLFFFLPIAFGPEESQWRAASSARVDPGEFVEGQTEGEAPPLVMPHGRSELAGLVNTDESTGEDEVSPDQGAWAMRSQR